MEQIKCVVERITYQGGETGFSVLRCKVPRELDLVTVVGVMPEVHVGSELAVEGFWKMDPKYGRQFQAVKLEETVPATVAGIEKYLGSGLIKGIGPKFARRIVKKFGKDTIDILDNRPDLLIEVEGIGQVRVDRIKKSWHDQKEIKNIMLFLQSSGVTTSHATKIYKTYAENSIKIVKENPYRLADDIWGIGFKTADQIAMKLGIEFDSAVRLRSGIIYTLNKLSEDGDCFSFRERLVETAVELLSLNSTDNSATNKIDSVLNKMITDKDVICEMTDEGEIIYLPCFYYAETGTAKRIRKLISSERDKQIDSEKVMKMMETSTDITYDEIQLEAIRVAVTSKVMVLTGGPGTGKTTTTQGIIKAYRSAGFDIRLAAPTGRAAKRMSEATGMESKTIHRLLEFKPPNGYERNEDNPLDGDILIVDESSMIDIILMNSLLKAIPDSMTLIMVGDIDQLPSVGAGNVLRDVINSGSVPVVRLTRIFRQAQGSRIIMNAHRINQGGQIDIRGGEDADFFFTQRDTNEDIVALIVDFCKNKLPNHYRVDPKNDIQVLTPMQRGVTGAANLNQLLQEAMNPTNICLKRGGIQYRLGDKVMQVRNNYVKDVYNGDIGIISSVDMEEQELVISYDGREIVYDVTELDEVVLAYATTIHKSQGSEYPIVVMPVSMSHYVMLQRNLIYTGVTRAKKAIFLVGELKAVYYAIRNETTTKRNTRLSFRLGSDDSLGKCRNQGEGDIDNAGKCRNLGAKNGAIYDSRINGVDVDALFRRLGESEFRSRFRLSEEDKRYIDERGMPIISSHATEIISKRIAPKVIANDGKQTPMKGHPVFLAQHATATCCRDCLFKWHNIKKDKELSEQEIQYIVTIITRWIERQL